jgi:S-DNA-T family DNA segregation ATPase FtsK/SpoIIIE
MGTVVIKRAPRRAAPPLPTGDIAVEPPPAIPQPTGARWQQLLSFLPMVAGTLATALMFGGRQGGGSYTYVVGGIFGISTLGMMLTNIGGNNGPKKAELMQARRDYLRYLAGVRKRVRVTIGEQRAALAHRNPDPDALWAEAIGPRVWERRPTDGDFGVVRIGTGPQSLATQLIAPVIDPAADLEPVTSGALRRFLRTYAIVPDLPIAVALRAFARILLRDAVQDDRAARALARAMVCQLATFHAPDDLLVVACVSQQHRAEWEWLKWLPHALHPTEYDALGQRRLIGHSLVELETLLSELVSKRHRFAASGASASPHLFVILDGGDTTGSMHLGVEGGLDGVTFVELGTEPPRNLDRATIVLTVGEGVLHSTTVEERAEVGRADAMSVPDAEALARRLAPLRLAAAAREAAPLAVDHDLTDLLEISDLTIADVATLWRPRAPRDVLRVPIGTGSHGDPVELDIKESAQDGMGPHGLLIGATGSGKSELLRTLVLGLAATHSSEALNFVLIDFKGGATFATLDRLPHTSAVITNLADELPLVDRMTDALNGELVRRQELLRHAGNFASVRDYDRARAASLAAAQTAVAYPATGPAPEVLPPLPSLLVVCDEFSELLTAKPDFIELFVQIGRLGRSLGVHLLLASQRLEEGRLRGLETHLSYRIGLRTFSAMESRAVLGVPDAYELPRSPGHGYLKFGTEPLQRFKAAYVSGPYRRRITSTGGGGSGERLPVLEYTSHFITPTQLAPPVEAVHSEVAAESMMDLFVDRLAGRGAPAHRVWLPPLSDPPSLDELLGGLGTDPSRGVTTVNPSLRGALQVPVALVDRPFEQRRDVHWLDLATAAGHVAIVGGPQSGKSTAARTLVTALALTHTPREVQVYCLDFGGGSLSAVKDLPHVGGVAGRLDTNVVRRTVGEVATLLADREKRFAALGIDSMATFRRLRRPSDLDATVAVPEDGFGDVFLVVDGWATLRAEYEDLEPVLTDIATRGLSYGIHVVGTASRWMDFRPAIKDLFGSRLELRLGDPGDSSVNRRVAMNVPERTPGRGLTPNGAHLLVALPQATTHDASALVKVIATNWTGQPAPRVRMLPPLLPYSSILARTEQGTEVPMGKDFALPLGIAESDLRPVLVDFYADSHLVVFGDSECGKSSLLRSLAESVTRRFDSARVAMIVVDYRRSLLGTVPPNYLVRYCTNADDTAPLIATLAQQLVEERQAGPEVTPEQLRTRAHWKGQGKEVFVLVDDYDLVATGPSNPLTPLVPLLSRSRDLGVHLVLTRRAGGAARASFDPVLQGLRDLAVPGLVMSGERSEGALVGNVAPAQLPPGRGRLVTRRDGVRLIQLAYLPPPA